MLNRENFLVCTERTSRKLEKKVYSEFIKFTVSQALHILCLKPMKRKTCQFLQYTRIIIKIKLLNTGNIYHIYVHSQCYCIITSYMNKSKADTVFCFSSKLWVLNSGREDLLEKDSTYLYKNCKLCANHFEDSCFRNHKKNRLHETAVPTIFSHHEIIKQRLLGKGIASEIEFFQIQVVISYETSK